MMAISECFIKTGTIVAYLFIHYIDCLLLKTIHSDVYRKEHATHWYASFTIVNKQIIQKPNLPSRYFGKVERMQSKKKEMIFLNISSPMFPILIRIYFQFSGKFQGKMNFGAFELFATPADIK